jgi:predicted transcriptional regulator
MTDKAYVKELEKTVEQLQKQLLETQIKLEKYESPPYKDVDRDTPKINNFSDFLNEVEDADEGF